MTTTRTATATTTAMTRVGNSKEMRVLRFYDNDDDWESGTRTRA
jgi:hypothetical protein